MGQDWRAEAHASSTQEEPDSVWSVEHHFTGDHMAKTKGYEQYATMTDKIHMRLFAKDVMPAPRRLEQGASR